MVNVKNLNQKIHLLGTEVPIIMTTLRAIGCIVLFSLPQIGLSQHPDVHEEPYHQPILEHNGLRYLHVSAKHSDTTAYHVHRNPILYLCIKGTEVWLDEWQKEPKSASLPTGWIGNDIYGPTDTLLHRFAVVGESALKIIAVEQIGESTPIRVPDLPPLYKEGGWCVYELDWETYLKDGYCNETPAVVPPHAFSIAAGVTYGLGHLIRPVEAGYAPATGMSSVWIVMRCGP